MATVTYEYFIPQNIAPKEATAIGVYNSNGRKIGTVGLGHLAFPTNLGEKLYSAGILSDVHVSQDTAEADFRRALTYFQDTEKVDFVCIAGDLTQLNETSEWELYAQCVAQESENTPVYPIGGNHDAYGSGLSDALFRQYTGFNTFYTFEKNGDVFIMLSNLAYPSKSGNLPPFVASQLQMLYNALETNRNKRCFVFQHYFMVGYAGDPANVYGSTTLFGIQETVLRSLMEHYPNAIWLHGHSHQSFESQMAHEKTIYDDVCGCHNIHIPSCYMPVVVSKFNDAYSKADDVNGSQGYVMDVYANAIVLKGRDFTKGAFVPLGIYHLDTTLKTVAAGTYADSTGTITT